MQNSQSFREAERKIEEFYSMSLDLSYLFPEVTSEHKADIPKQSMSVLLLGSYKPSIPELMGSYEKGEPKITEKLQKGIELLLSEKMLFVQKLVEHMGNKVMIGNRSARNIRNTWNRQLYLMEKSDYIIVLLNNTGGVMCEHAIITEREYSNKTVNFVKEGEKLSGIILQGSLMMPNTRLFWYKDDLQLADLVIRTTESYGDRLSRRKEK